MTEGTIAPEQIIINGQAFSPEDATQLIELGSKYRKMESDLNTSLDKVYPEYTRLSQAKKTWDEEKTKIESELQTLREAEAKRQKVKETPDDVKQIREAARQVGLLDEDLIKERGYMTREEVEKMISEKDELKKAAQGVMDQAEKLEREIDGKDGRVPFNKDAVMAYAYVNNIPNLQEAYDKMNERFNAGWKQQQIDAAQRPGLTTLQPGGKKEPVKAKITNNNLSQALGEWLEGIPE